MNLRHFLFPKSIDTIGNGNQSNRNQWIEKILLSIPEGSSLLDAGAGQMPYRKFCNHLKYKSQDFCAYDGKGNQSGLQTQNFDTTGIDVVSDIVQLPFENGAFDAVLCSEVIEHVPDANKVIMELLRVLKPGGYLVLTAPFCSLTHYAPYHFSTGFNKYFYEQYNHALDIIEMTANGNFYEYLAQEVKRVPSVAARYSNSKITWWERLITYAYLLLLSRKNTEGNGSAELLCFGYHLLAKKK